MAKPKQKNMGSKPIKRPRPASTPEARESQLIALAIERVEQRICDDTATAQEICHFLKLGSVRAQLEMEKLRSENELLRAKTEQIDTEKQVAELFKEAIVAMKSYTGDDDEEDDDY